MSADHKCPMCWRPVLVDAPAILEQGDRIHVECHLGLMDAGSAVARLLRERRGQPLCGACIAATLGLTLAEAQTASARLRSLRGFDARFETCLTCRARRRVLRAVRGQYVQERMSDSTLRE
jgi:hypothetical protein